MGATCVFLACKTEESLRKSQDLIKVVVRNALKQPLPSVEAQNKVLFYSQQFILLT